MAAQKRFRPAGHTSAPALPGTGTGTGTGGHVSFDVPSSSAGAPPADIRLTVPAAPPPAPGPDVVVANPVQNFLPLRHHPPQPRGRLEGGGEGYCPLRIPAAWRALEDGLLRAG